MPLCLVATLCFGLRENSRIKLLQANMPVDTDTILLASAVDRLSLLAWMKSEDGHKGHNRPPSIVNSFMESGKPKDYKLYSSVGEFERVRQNLIKGK